MFWTKRYLPLICLDGFWLTLFIFYFLVQAVVELSQSTAVRLNVGGKVFTTLRETLHGSVFLNDLFAEVTRGRLRFPTDERYQERATRRFHAKSFLSWCDWNHIFLVICFLISFCPAAILCTEATRVLLAPS
jgi:hypothetical protein